MRDDLAQALGRTETVTDVIAARPVDAMFATLDRPHRVRVGDPLPALWHWLFFLPLTPRSGLGPDGHPRLGEFIPDTGLPRRMFAGGRIRITRPIRVGDRVERTSTITSITPKQGRTGPLVFVTVRHDITSNGEPRLIDEQDLVYRQARPVARPEEGERSPEPGEWTAGFVPDHVTLFRFSALTFNAHRIHYDQPYVTGVEGYPDLVVHGPLIAIVLARLAADRSTAPITAFEFRAEAPAFVGDEVLLRGDPGEGEAQLFAWNDRGVRLMSARVAF